jgi:hypothetical protein
MATAGVSVYVVMGAWATAMVLLLGWASVGEVGWGLAAMVTAEVCLLLALVPVATEFWRGHLPTSTSDCARDILLDVSMVSPPWSGPSDSVSRRAGLSNAQTSALGPERDRPGPQWRTGCTGLTLGPRWRRLCCWQRQWRATRARQTPGFIWLRALRLRLPSLGLRFEHCRLRLTGRRSWKCKSHCTPN